CCDRDQQLQKDIMDKDRKLTKDISDWTGQEARRDHLQERLGPTTADMKTDDRDFQTDKSANALSRDQMAGIDKNASYNTTTNPDKEVGGVDHMSQSRPMNDTQAQNRNLRS